jgi:hypothetical protein
MAPGTTSIARLALEIGRDAHGDLAFTVSGPGIAAATAVLAGPPA